MAIVQKIVLGFLKLFCAIYTMHNYIYMCMYTCAVIICMNLLVVLVVTGVGY